jgi:hypothetical protein
MRRYSDSRGSSGGGSLATGTGIIHVTGGVTDPGAYLGSAGQILIVNAGATDTAWQTVSQDVLLAPSGAATVQGIQTAAVASTTPTSGQLLIFGDVNPGWTPASLGAALVAWYRSDLGTHLSGGTITQWDDQSGNGYNLAGGVAPIYSASGGANNRPYLSATGTQYLVNASLPAASGAATWIVVMRPTVSNPGGNFTFAASPGPTYEFYQHVGTNNLRLYAGAEVCDTAITPGTDNVVEIVWNGATSSIAVNGGAPNVGNTGGTFPTGQLSVFATTGGGNPATGYIYEFFAVNRALTGPERASLLTYINYLYHISDGYLRSTRWSPRSISGGITIDQNGAANVLGVSPANITFEGRPLTIDIPGNGNGTLQWPAGQATPAITQAIPASDVVPADMRIGAQSAFPGASTNLVGANIILAPGAGASANGSPGSVFVAIPGYTGSGVDGYLNIQRNGVTGLSLGAYSGGTFWTIRFGANARTPTAVNFSFLQDDAGNDTQLNGNQSVRLRVGGAADQVDLNASGVQLFGNNTYSLGGGTGVLGITNAIAVPTSAPTGGGILWMNTGSPGSLGLFATGIQFHRLAGTITISQDAPASNIATTGLTIAGQPAFNGTPGAAILLGGGTNAGSVQGTIGTPTAQTWAWTVTTIAATTGTVTLSSSQYNSPLIKVSSTLTGNLVLVFPNQAGYWIVDTTSLTLGIFTLTLQSGTATFLATSGKLYTAVSYGGNTMSVSFG